jgi:ATP-dependent Clp protease protease subunit
MTSQQPVQQPNEAYAIFCSMVDQAATQRLLGNLALVTQDKTVTGVHLLFQSPGGNIGDGVCLYNVFRAYPLPLTLYNAGAIMSVAAIAYLGAKTRKTSAHAIFNLHRSTFSPQAASAGTLESLAEAVLLEDKRTETILREHLSLTETQWKNLDRPGAGLWLSATDALQAKMATAIGDFAPPIGTKMFTF